MAACVTPIQFNLTIIMISIYTPNHKVKVIFLRCMVVATSLWMATFYIAQGIKYQKLDTIKKDEQWEDNNQCFSSSAFAPSFTSCYWGIYKIWWSLAAKGPLEEKKAKIRKGKKEKDNSNLTHVQQASNFNVKHN